jgi:hypothetical protein
MLHTPPVIASVSVTVLLGQSATLPLIGPGIGFTVSIMLATQPAADV